MAAGDDQPEIHRTADAADRRLVAQLLTTLGIVATAALERQLLAALAKRQMAKVIQIVRAAMAPAIAVFQSELTSTLLLLERETFSIGARTASLEAIGSLNLTNPQAVEFARTRGSRFVAQFEQDLQQMLRRAVSTSFIEGIPPRDAALLIRDSIGLTANQLQAVANYRRFLEGLGSRELLTDLAPTSLERIRRSDIRLLPKRGAAMTDERIDQMVGRYRTRLLKERALTLVSNESMAASNQGQLILWRDAVANGLLNEAAVRKKFIITKDEKVCPICRPMAGQLQPLSGSFVSPYDGSSAKAPPMHWRCRCTVGLTRVKAS